MNKELILDDRFIGKDNTSMNIHKTSISMYIHGEEIPIWTRHNMITAAGGSFTARSQFALAGAEITPSYDTVLDGFKAVTNPSSTGANKVCLFAVGTDGCGTEASQVKPVIYNSWITPASLVPFKFESADIDSGLKSLYSGFCKPSSGKYIYYFKTFDSTPIFVQKFLDGSIANSTNIYQNTAVTLESYVEVKLKISSSDCRSFFGDNTAAAKINSLSLLYATPVVENGITYHKDIRPITKLHFPNESLADPEKGLDIVYRIYY